jgi:hypothetical protein
MMNHCVGQSGMGYIDAVKRGETEIWSLRSRDNKPRFTLEVDASFHDADDNAARPQTGAIPTWARELPQPHRANYLRATAIKQVKGKGNRTPGYADVRKTGGIKFPDEVIFWDSVFRAMGVDIDSVEDFDAPQAIDTPLRLRANGEVCTGFDLPYRRGVRQNRRSSKRRGSKRRTSRRRSSRM